MYSHNFGIPFLFESIVKGQEISQNRPDFVLALGKLDCVDDSLYQLILQLCDLEDASERRAAETHKIVEQIAVLFRLILSP